jgi:hypothetical protein
MLKKSLANMLFFQVKRKKVQMLLALIESFMLGVVLLNVAKIDNM